MRRGYGFSPVDGLKIILLFGLGLALFAYIPSFTVQKCTIRVDILVLLTLSMYEVWFAIQLMMFATIFKKTAYLDFVTFLTQVLILIGSIATLILLPGCHTEDDGLCRKEFGWVVYIFYWVLSLLSTVAGVLIISKMNRQDRSMYFSLGFARGDTRSYLTKVYKQRNTLEGWETLIIEGDRLKYSVISTEQLHAIEAAYRMYLIDEFSWKLSRQLAEEISAITAKDKRENRWEASSLSCYACQEGFKANEAVFVLKITSLLWHRDCAVRYLMRTPDDFDRDDGNPFSRDAVSTTVRYSWESIKKIKRGEVEPRRFEHKGPFTGDFAQNHPQNQKIGLLFNAGQHLLDIIAIRRRTD